MAYNKLKIISVKKNIYYSFVHEKIQIDFINLSEDFKNILISLTIKILCSLHFDLKRLAVGGGQLTDKLTDCRKSNSI